MEKPIKNKLESMNFGFFLFLILFPITSFSQLNEQAEQVEDDSIKLHLYIREMNTSKDFLWKYNRELEKVRRVYPMALKAKTLIDSYEKDLIEIEKHRKQKKYSKEAHQDLKDQFTYSIRDLYISEGVLLMQLVERETNLTVAEIIKKYRGGFQATIYDKMGDLFEQDLNAKYDPKGVNWITEIVIQDILNGDVEFNPEMDELTKAEFKQTQAEYRQRKKESHKNVRLQKREQKEMKKEKKRSERRERQKI